MAKIKNKKDRTGVEHVESDQTVSEEGQIQANVGLLENVGACSIHCMCPLEL